MVLARVRGAHVLWTEEPGSLYDGEVMLVGRAEDASITIWVYDDAIDYCLRQSDVINFEAESFHDEQALLTAVLAHLQQRMQQNPEAPDVPRA